MLAPFLLAAIIPGVLAPHSPDALLGTPFSRPSQLVPARHRRGRPRHPLAAHLRRPRRPGDQPQRDADRRGDRRLHRPRGRATGAGTGAPLCLRVTDVMLAFPSLLLALFLIAVVGPSDTIVVVALMILYIPGFMRLSRGLALQLRERSFVEASHISGVAARSTSSAAIWSRTRSGRCSSRSR